jgi:hypothetical protein
MKIIVRNYSCLQNPWLGGHRPQIPVLSVLCPQLNLLNPLEQNSWVRHCSKRPLYKYNITTARTTVVHVSLSSSHMNWISVSVYCYCRLQV